MQTSTPLTQSPGKVGTIAGGVQAGRRIGSYIKPKAGGFATAVLQLDLIGPAAPFNSTKNQRDTLTIRANANFGDTLNPIEIRYEFPDPLLTGAALVNDLVDNFLTTNPRLARLGSFVVSGTNINFQAYESGVDVEFSLQADPTRVSHNFVATPSPTFSGKYPAGIVVVTDPFADASILTMRDESDYGAPYQIAYLPTQDLSNAASTQQFAGILMECEAHENVPTDPTYPRFSNVTEGDFGDHCLRVLEGGAPIWVRAETPYYHSAGDPAPRVHYRFTADLANGLTQLGAISLDPAAAGVVELPAPHTIKGIYEGGTLIKLQLH